MYNRELTQTRGNIQTIRSKNLKVPVMSEQSRMKRLARNLRGRLTDCEKILWSRLSHFKRSGYHFRRQVAIGPYVVDFACKQARIVVEADGVQHGQDQAPAQDAMRDRWLSEQGYLILRFGNADIRRSLDTVSDAVFAACKARCSVAHMIADDKLERDHDQQVRRFGAE
jgi:very-short-patch-repair endonuclease